MFGQLPIQASSESSSEVAFTLPDFLQPYMFDATGDNLLPQYLTPVTAVSAPILPDAPPLTRMVSAEKYCFSQVGV